uniref:Metallothionein n=1 Tax=uncultured Armatimonadetes bacterium TaxID=157466 RepID=A0A6J4IN59_9BACT|nr:hypothetical protein AVDCRST_MAG63-2091 [uncultured Armatimonadetes bacterium]
MNEPFIMRPGDTFVARECGCAFTVTSGPSSDDMATQAPRCCCGHEMKKQGAEQNNQSMTGGAASGVPPATAR